MPAEQVMTELVPSALSFPSLNTAPRSLNEPVFCRFSSFIKYCDWDPEERADDSSRGVSHMKGFIKSEASLISSIFSSFMGFIVGEELIRGNSEPGFLKSPWMQKNPDEQVLDRKIYFTLTLYNWYTFRP